MNRLNVCASLVFLAFILSGLTLSAQDVDHLYLKSGSVIRGKILEIDPADHVKIQDLCGNLWYYKFDDIEKISSEPFRKTGMKFKEDLTFTAGFVNITSMGFLAGSNLNNQVAPFSLLMSNGYRNSLGIFTGAGIGIEFLNTNYIPIFADLRYDFFEGDVVPYVMIKGGYSLPMVSKQSENQMGYEYFGGPLFGTGVGLKIKAREHFAWDISLLYRYQRTSYNEIYEWNDQTYEYSNVYNRIEIRLGFYID